MSRQSNNDYDENGTLRNGFDYDLQVWVVDYLIPDCKHPREMKVNGSCCCQQDRLKGNDTRKMNHTFRVFK